MIPRLALLLFCAVWLLSVEVAGAAELEIEDVQIELRNTLYLLRGQIDFNLSDDAQEALDNGVPLTFELHILVRRKGAWIWEESLFDYQVRHTIRYKPLSERYSIDQPGIGETNSFVTRDAALAALGKIRDLRLIETKRLDPSADYEVRMRVALDIDDLPLPLRPIAYLKPAWKLESRWSKWPLEP